MKAVVQRVKNASVEINGKVVGEIGEGLLVLLGIAKGDNRTIADKLLKKVLDYRIFSDVEGKMNLSLKDTEGELLVVSQFTLVADTRKGMRPSFSSAATPELGREMYDYWINEAQKSIKRVATGQFGGDMQVNSQNDGPVTFVLEAN